MKTLIQLFLCSTILLSMFGCSKPKIDDEAIDRIIPAVQKFAEVDSFDYELGFEAPLTNGKLYGSCILDELQLSLFLDLCPFSLFRQQEIDPAAPLEAPGHSLRSEPPFQVTPLPESSV